MTVYVGFVCDITEAYFKNMRENESHWGTMLSLNQRKKKEAWLVAAGRFSQGMCGQMGKSSKRWVTSKLLFLSEVQHAF